MFELIFSTCNFLIGLMYGQRVGAVADKPFLEAAQCFLNGKKNPPMRETERDREKRGRDREREGNRDRDSCSYILKERSSTC